MADPQVPGYTQVTNPTGAYGLTVQTPNTQDQYTLAEAPAPGVYKAAILADAPTIYWPLDETSGTVIHDASGNGYNGTLVIGSGSLGAPGPFPNDPGRTALSGNGSSITAAGYTVPSGGWTAVSIEFWANLQGIPGAGNSTNRMVAIGHPDSANNGIELWVPSAVNYISGYIGNSSAPLTLVPTINSQALTTNIGWHQYVLTYGGTTGKLYLDGVLVASGTLTGPLTSETSRFAVAALYLSSVSNQMYGLISQVSYWQSATLSAARVLAHYQAGAYV